MRRPAGAQATRPLRIAMIGSRGVPARWGGIERHVEELSALLVERGHHVTVFCRSNYVQERVPEYRGMRLRQLPTISTKHLDAIVHSGLATSAAMASSFDILHYHALGPGVMGVLPRFLSAAIWGAARTNGENNFQSRCRNPFPATFPNRIRCAFAAVAPQEVCFEIRVQ